MNKIIKMCEILCLYILVNHITIIEITRINYFDDNDAQRLQCKFRWGGKVLNEYNNATLKVTVYAWIRIVLHAMCKDEINQYVDMISIINFYGFSRYGKNE